MFLGGKEADAKDLAPQMAADGLEDIRDLGQKRLGCRRLSSLSEAVGLCREAPPEQGLGGDGSSTVNRIVEAGERARAIPLCPQDSAQGALDISAQDRILQCVGDGVSVS